jgi:hypothetical protein
MLSTGSHCKLSGARKPDVLAWGLTKIRISAGHGIFWKACRRFHVAWPSGFDASADDSEGRLVLCGTLKKKLLCH